MWLLVVWYTFHFSVFFAVGVVCVLRISVSFLILSSVSLVLNSTFFFLEFEYWKNCEMLEEKKKKGRKGKKKSVTSYYYSQTMQHFSALLHWRCLKGFNASCWLLRGCRSKIESYCFSCVFCCVTARVGISACGLRYFWHLLLFWNHKINTCSFFSYNTVRADT